MSFSGQTDLIIYNGSLCVLKVPNTPTKKNQMINEINIYFWGKNLNERRVFIFITMHYQITSIWLYSLYVLLHNNILLIFTFIDKRMNFGYL